MLIFAASNKKHRYGKNKDLWKGTCHYQIQGTSQRKQECISRHLSGRKEKVRVLEALPCAGGGEGQDRRQKEEQGDHGRSERYRGAEGAGHQERKGWHRHRKGKDEAR